ERDRARATWRIADHRERAVESAEGRWVEVEGDRARLTGGEGRSTAIGEREGTRDRDAADGERSVARVRHRERLVARGRMKQERAEVHRCRQAQVAELHARALQ